MKRVAVIQSNYIPWKGYFDMIHDADIFVFYDDVQYTKEDWRNRNKIKTPEGASWLTVPCGENISRLVCEVELPGADWQRRHWKTITRNYGRAAGFQALRPFFEELYLKRRWKTLSEMNQAFITAIARELLGIRTEFCDSRSFRLPDAKKEDRWVELVRQICAGSLLIGPSARNYLDEEKQRRIRDQGIELVWKDYSGYPEYRQLFPPFEHNVSILDLIFNCGYDSPYYIWGWRDGARPMKAAEGSASYMPGQK